MPYINSVAEFEKALEEGAFAWPGGYPLYFVTADCDALSFDAVKENAELCKEAIAEPCPDTEDWRIVGVEINWEDAELICAHTYKRIPSAYAED